MLKNYLLIAFRNLWRQKAFSAINIMGLGIGMACSILIPIAMDLKKDIPEIINSFMYYRIFGVVTSDDHFFNEEIWLADPALWDMFTFKFLRGDPPGTFLMTSFWGIAAYYPPVIYPGRDIGLYFSPRL